LHWGAPMQEVLTEQYNNQPRELSKSCPVAVIDRHCLACRGYAGGADGAVQRPAEGVARSRAVRELPGVQGRREGAAGRREGTLGLSAGDNQPIMGQCFWKDVLFAPWVQCR